MAQKTKENIEFKQIVLAEIRPNPHNPRKNFSGRAFDELEASVLKKGVIQPIMVRPVKGRKKKYEIVFGERRYRASCKVAEQNGGLAKGTIPALVRKLDDDQAFDLMTIENLQREDLTDLEEAHGFKQWIDKKGEATIPELAERISLSPRYIRRRVAVLGLPEKILQTWSNNEIGFGHLEQLTRLQDEKLVMEFFDSIMEEKGWSGHICSVADLKHDIDEQSPELGTALFNLDKEKCVSCRRNSDLQKKLFDTGTEKTKCLSPKCFKQKQNNWLLSNWANFRKERKLATNGFRFHDTLAYTEYETFYTLIEDKCFECENFVTLLRLDGETYSKQVCIGDKTCFKNQTAPPEQKTKDGEKTGPRVSWHGDHFREIFYQEQLPKRIGSISPDDLKIEQLALFSILVSNSKLHGWFAVRHEMRKREQIDPDWFYLQHDEIFKQVSTMEHETVVEEIKEAAIQVTLQSDTGLPARQLVGDHIGIDLKTEWRITEEYLKKKTIAEITAIAEQFKVFEQEKANTYLVDQLGKKAGDFRKCKKGELVKVFLESGIDLAGVVPDEILNADSR